MAKRGASHTNRGHTSRRGRSRSVSQTKALAHARARLNRGDTAGAIEVLSAAVRRDPTCVAAHEALGRLLESTDPGRARTAFEAVIRTCRDSVRGQVALAKLHLLSGRHDLAIGPLSQALRQEPEKPLRWQELGDALALLGEFDRARDCYERGRFLAPNASWPLVGLATVCERTGEPAHARSLLEPLINRGCREARVLVAWARACRRAGRPDEPIALLTEHLSAIDEAEARARLGHVLGECFDAVQQWAEAFQAFQAANNARPATYDKGEYGKFVDALVQSWSSDANSFFTDASNVQTERFGARPLLIVGMPRSGTSLVEQILSAHDAVYAGGERETMGDLVREFFPRYAPSDIDSARAAEFRDQYLASFETPDSAQLFTDKLPDNYVHLGMAAQCLPGLRVIHCRRDRYDTAFSCYAQDFGSRLRYTRRLDALAARGRDEERLMDHWKSVLPVPIHTVQYESLVREPEREIRALLEFCGLPWTEACLHPEHQKRVVATASYAQVSQPMHTRSIGRARPYMQWLESDFD